MSNICSKDNSWAEILGAKKSMEHHTAVSLLQTHNCAILVDFFFFFTFVWAHVAAGKHNIIRTAGSFSLQVEWIYICPLCKWFFTILLFAFLKWEQSEYSCALMRMFSKSLYSDSYSNTYFFINIKISYWCILYLFSILFISILCFLYLCWLFHWNLRAFL